MIKSLSPHAKYFDGQRKKEGQLEDKRLTHHHHQHTQMTKEVKDQLDVDEQKYDE
jgi:hypothetical protein